MDVDSTLLLGGSNEQNPQFIFPEDTGVYCTRLHVITDAGCEDDTVRCLLIDGIYNVFVPNAFTPNGDGLNDHFFPKGIGINPTDGYQLLIFNRWGEIIWTGSALDNEWDGTAAAKGSSDIVQNDVYIWKLKTTEVTRKGYDHEYIGHVTVVR